MPGALVILCDPTVASYGTISALYVDTFRAMGLPCQVRPYPAAPPRVPRGTLVLHCTLGPRFAPVPGAVNIAVPFHEWSRYPSPWALRLNAFEEVWAASAHLASLLRASGVTVPVRFAPPALDLRPPAAKRAWAPHRPFRFLFVGEPHFRKGHHLLIGGFQRLLGSSRGATLTIKTSQDCTWTTGDARIHLARGRWTDARMARLYAAHDAFVSASLGEGLGMGVAEAILAGLPVAANFWGGHTSLLVPQGYVRIPHRVVPQPYCSRPDFYADGQQCALSTVDQVADAMARIMALSATARAQQAGRARAHLLARFGLAAASARLRTRLAAVNRRRDDSPR